MSEGFVIHNGKANFELCHNCGAAIKNVFWFRDKPYGSTCIEKVTGNKVSRWVVREDGVIDEEATANRYKPVATSVEKPKENEYREENQWLITALEWYDGDFTASMVHKLCNNKLKYDNFSPRMVNIMCDMYAKNFGRRNSKKYNAAADHYWDVFDANRDEE